MQTVQSDRILDLVQSAAKVETEIETHTEEIATGLDDDFAPILEGWGEEEEKPDHRAQLRALKDKLGASREELSEIEERHIDLIKRAVELRGERGALTDVLYEDFSSMRRSVEELYRGKGKGNADVFVLAGIQGPTAQRPSKLLRQVELAIKHLHQPGLVFPASRFEGIGLDPVSLAKALVPAADRLGQVLDGVRQVASEMNASRKERNRAIKAHQRTFSRVAQTAEAFFRLAGEDELAERIRPSGRRPGRRAVEVPGEGGDEPQTDGSRDGNVPGDDAAGSDAPAGSPAEAGSGDGSSGEPTGEPEPAPSEVVDPVTETAPPPEG